MRKKFPEIDYHVSVHELAQTVLHHLRRQELLQAGDRVGVAVSGGIDSVALLRLLMELRRELGIVLAVIHFDHRLRGEESEGDQKFVEDLAREHGLEFYGAKGDVAELAAERRSGLEAAGRELRYGFFRRLLGASDGEFEPNIRQGLKPASLVQLSGTTEVAPVPIAPLPIDPFSDRASGNALDKIATGHTLDDQAETVLMRIVRGTGMRGLGGIFPRVAVEGEDGDARGEIVRPLLSVRRRDLEQYLRDIGQPWREDSSNTDSRFTRNRLRKLVLPLLEREFNPAVVEGLSELAEIARDEEDYWDGEVSGWLGTVVQWSEPEWARGEVQGLVQVELAGAAGGGATVPTAAAGENEVLRSAQDDRDNSEDDRDHETEDRPSVAVNCSVSRPWLLTEPRAVQRRLIKAVGEEAGIPLEFKHIEEILRFAAEEGPAGKQLSLPLGWKILREPEAMVFLAPDLRGQESVPDYEYSLTVPGRAAVPELGGVIEALRFDPVGEFAEYNPQQLLRADLLPERLTVRNWRPGDRFWPAHTKVPKKVKELLQDKHIGQPDRRLWPVVLSGDEIIWMRGFPVSAKLRAGREHAVLLIRETLFEEDD